AFTMTFDLVAHRFLIQCSDGRTESIALEPRTVAEFYRQVMDALRRMGIDVRIWTMPVEVPNPIRFEADETHHSYDPRAAHAFWQVLVSVKPVLEQFRSAFVGKCSPVHFFWGSFDLAVTRFSGRPAPPRPGADSITRDAYSHECSSVGFWPGGPTHPAPAYYAYAAPAPPAFEKAVAQPREAYYDNNLG